MRFDYKNDYRVQPIVTAYKAGKDVRELQKNFGVSAGTVYRILDHNNIPRRYHHTRYTNDVMKSLTPADLHEIMDQYNSGIPIKAIEDDWNLNKNAFYVILDKHIGGKVNPLKYKQNLWELVE